MPPRDSIFFDLDQTIRSASGISYKCIQRLGVGGNSATFLVYADMGTAKGTLFALKIFRKLSQPSRRTAFLREVEFLKNCAHPSVMRVFDTGLFTVGTRSDRAEYPFVIAEYLPTTLAETIRSRASTMPEKVSYSLQLLSAICFLSSLPRPVVHRDIKPNNVLIKGQSCVLADFGLMKLLDEGDDDGREILRESTGPGMPWNYRTPDLVAYVKNESSLTGKTDVFQLGLVLAELFTGYNICESSEEITSPVSLKPLGNIHGELSGGIASLIKKMLIMNPLERPSACDLMDGWIGVFKEAVARATELEGRAFKS
jgi:serine/threonine protein kinase